MKEITYNLWEDTPGIKTTVPVITRYVPDNKLCAAAVVIFPGGGYAMHAPYEGEGYARFLANHGFEAFSVNYRIAPEYSFPFPLLDARRAVRFVRYHAEKFGIDKDKVAVMGSSAGGHLAALLSTYTEPVEFEGADEIDNEDFMPDRQILCYPVINLYDKNFAHIGSGDNLLGDNYDESQDIISRMSLSPDRLVGLTTPDAFVWHTFDDSTVNVKNSLKYVAALKDYGVPAELHIFPHGRHGLGLADVNENKDMEHVSGWPDMLLKWLNYTWNLG